MSVFFLWSESACPEHTPSTPYSLYVEFGRDFTGKLEAIALITVG